MEVLDFSDLPEGFASLPIPHQRCAVFTHAGHGFVIRSAWRAIVNDRSPTSGQALSDGLERELYGGDFDG
jgi:predicted transcriptional regulator YdeE